MRGAQLHQGKHLPRMRYAAFPPPDDRPRRSARPRYQLRLGSQGVAPWSATMSRALVPVFGDDDLGRKTIILMQNALGDNTYGNYESNLRHFWDFCAEFDIAPLDVSPVQIARYVTWLGERGTIASDSLQPYMSAINRFLEDHGRAPTALGPIVTSVRRGLSHCQVAQPHRARVAP